jgi:hypothetical protein
LLAFVTLSAAIIERVRRRRWPSKAAGRLCLFGFKALVDSPAGREAD